MSAQSLGWTLIHSLWQGMAIYVVLRISVRVARTSDVKYAMGVAAMALLLVCSIITYFTLIQTGGSDSFQVVLTATQASAVQSSSVLDWINSNIIWFIRFWSLGFVIGILRIAAGLWYINRLRRNSFAVQDEWMDMVKRISETLNINRVVSIAEAGISSPMVVGFMKPVILFPIGLLSGLTSEQVETILIHELSHIRRQDYIINLVQSVIETIFFFNPFALLMSSMIREERENCCDDMVIAKGISPMSYVRTLAQLEAARSSSSLAMGFMGNQNQLLNRIKRIMENSAKNDWGKGRLVPVALLFLGLVCASWLSIASEKKIDANHKVIASDTSKDSGLIVIKRGNNHDDWGVIGPIEGPEPVELPETDFSMADMPPIPEFVFDSIPNGYTYSFHVRDPEGKANFEKEFTMKFKENFKEFYEKNQEKFDEMMKEVWNSEQMKKLTEDEWHREAMEVVDLADLQHMAEIDAIKAEDMALMFERQSSDMAALAQMSELRAFEQSQHALQGQKMQMDMTDQLREQERILEDMQRSTDAYFKELTKMLIEDGYVTKGETDNLSINETNGEVVINGKKIKEKDAVKYRALRDSFFGMKKRMMTPGRSE